MSHKPSLQQKTKEALNRLDTFKDQQHRLQCNDSTESLTCHFTSLDSMACEITKLEVQSTRLCGISSEKIKKLSDELAKKLMYLLEPLGVIETDPDGCVVQLRSSPPYQDTQEQHIVYYELLVRSSGSLQLCRYQKTANSPRELTTAYLTREVLLRIVDDFVTAIDGL